MDIIKPLMIADHVEMVGKVAIGTVKGDLHDIGKNLVAMMLEGSGFQVINLGTDVAPERYAPAIHAAGRDCCSRGLRPSRALHGFFDSLCSAQFAELFMCLRAPAAYAICSPAAPMHCKTICQHSAKLCLTG